MKLATLSLRRAIQQKHQDNLRESKFNSTKPFSSKILHRDIMNITSLIKHSNMSMAEGHPGIVRIITAHYISYLDTDNFTTNYTLGVSVVNNTVGEVNFVFEKGITFPDVIELNFTLTVDPELKRGVGAGAEVRHFLSSFSSRFLYRRLPSFCRQFACATSSMAFRRAGATPSRTRLNAEIPRTLPFSPYHQVNDRIIDKFNSISL